MTSMESVKGSKPVEIEGQEIGPNKFTILGSVVGSDARIEIEVLFKAGRYVAKSVKVTTLAGADTPVTADLLRAVSLEEMVREGVHRHMSHHDAGVAVKPDTSLGPIDENLRAVAVVYRRAYAAGDPPKRAVSDGLGLNVNTAARWIMKARERGFLGPTEMRRAGP